VIYVAFNYRLYPVLQDTRRLLVLAKTKVKQLYDMDVSLDGVYRAVVRGLQVGLAAVTIIWLLDTVLGISSVGTCTGFVLGALVGTAFTFYQDTLEVLLRK
jgi:predicted membrane protein